MGLKFKGGQTGRLYNTSEFLANSICWDKELQFPATLFLIDEETPVFKEHRNPKQQKYK